MWKSESVGGGASLICALAAKLTLFSAMAKMLVVPGATAVTTPVALTSAMDGSPLTQLSGAPAIGAPFTSKAVAVSVMLLPTLSVKLAGVIVMLATSGTGGGVPSSLQTPKLLVAGPFQVPSELRASDSPTGPLPVWKHADVGRGDAVRRSVGGGEDTFVRKEFDERACVVDERDTVGRAVLNAVRLDS